MERTGEQTCGCPITGPCRNTFLACQSSLTLCLAVSAAVRMSKPTSSLVQARLGTFAGASTPTRRSSQNLSAHILSQRIYREAVWICAGRTRPSPAQETTPPTWTRTQRRMAPWTMEHAPRIDSEVPCGSERENARMRQVVLRGRKHGKWLASLSLSSSCSECPRPGTAVHMMGRAVARTRGVIPRELDTRASPSPPFQMAR
ncbi:hypothetical protein GY45DRAFT_611560 [Cubamyces sp. BRFM 1775]|nr:hypothetical protein GY45DRAFT_611560 [Cubamyces sp. BRFM 1775]